jgi:dsRNA-specific ribonuclease
VSKRWTSVIAKNCIMIEQELVGFPFHNRDLLVRALLRKAAYNHRDFPPDYRMYGYQNGIDTLGGKVLDFAIYDHFIDTFLGYENLNRKQIKGVISGCREWYSAHDILQEFSMDCIILQKYVVWGTDEFDRQIWAKDGTKILADCFEALVGAVYTDQGLAGVKVLLEHIRYYDTIDRLRSEKGQKKSDFRMAGCGEPGAMQPASGRQDA